MKFMLEKIGRCNDIYYLHAHCNLLLINDSYNKLKQRHLLNTNSGQLDLGS